MSSNPMVRPLLLVSVSWKMKLLMGSQEIVLCSVAVNFSVVVALCALATAGSTKAAVPPRTAAAAAAVMDRRIFMVTLLLRGLRPSGHDERRWPGPVKTQPRLPGQAQPRRPCGG